MCLQIDTMIADLFNSRNDSCIRTSAMRACVHSFLRRRSAFGIMMQTIPCRAAHHCREANDLIMIAADCREIVWWLCELFLRFVRDVNETGWIAVFFVVCLVAFDTNVPPWHCYMPSCAVWLCGEWFCLGSRHMLKSLAHSWLVFRLDISALIWADIGIRAADRENSK